jgi:uracil-DNA glycosylase
LQSGGRVAVGAGRKGRSGGGRAAPAGLAIAKQPACSYHAAVSDPMTERAALLEQLAGYLAWEEELGGQALPRASLPLAPPAPEPTAMASPPEREQRSALAALASGSAADAAPANPEAAGDRQRRLAVLEEEVRGCTRCELHKARTQTVFARGNPASRLVFVGEGPGQEEDRTGRPFVGPAGQLLDKMVAAMGFGRDDVYICNIVKCRPPGNRTPLPSEAGACGPFLLGQLDAIEPAVIVALGRCAAENMGLVAGGGWRGRWGKFRGVDVMPTYHPAFLLRSPEFKRPVWEDLQKVMARLQGAK